MLHVAFHSKRAFEKVSDQHLTHVVIGRDVAIVNPGPPPLSGKDEIAAWQAAFMEGQDKARAGLYRLKDYGWYASLDDALAAEQDLHGEKFDLAIVEVNRLG